VADYTGSGCELINIDGIGPEKAETVEACLEAYWAKVRDEQEQEEPESEEDDGGSGSSDDG
jgi:hypothetical protein